MIRLNTDFHDVYLDLSTNLPLIKQVNILRQRLFEFNYNPEWLEKVPRLNYTEHLTMIDLIEKGCYREAADFMRDVHCSMNWLKTRGVSQKLNAQRITLNSQRRNAK